jgi:outer membrane protein, heavy metal efflux system
MEMISRSRTTCCVLFWIPLALLFVQGAWAESDPAISQNMNAKQAVTAAESQKSNDLIRLEDLISELRKSNPDLGAARKRYEAALTRPAQEGALPDPRITVGWISNGYPWPGSGLGSEATSNIGFQVAQEIPYPGKLALKSGMARKEADSEAQMYRAKELGLIAQLKNRFYELRFIYEAIDLLHRNQELLQQLARVANVRYAAGKAMQQDVVKAEIEVSILETRLVLFEQKTHALAAEINAILNRSVDRPLGRPEPIADIPSLEPISALQAIANQASPMVGAQQSIIDSRQLNVQAARKEYYPDFDFMSGYYNQGAMKPMWEFKVQVKIPLYYWRKQRYGLEEAGLRLNEAQRTYRYIQQDLSSGIRERYLAAEAARKLLDLYSKLIVPQSELALESSLASYETGGADFLTVLSNFVTIREYRMSYYEQQAEYMKALAGLEELTASPTFEAKSK